MYKNSVLLSYSNHVFEQLFNFKIWIHAEMRELLMKQWHRGSRKWNFATTSPCPGFPYVSTEGISSLSLCFSLPSSSLEWKKLFVTNWFAARLLWISHVDHNPLEGFPSPQLWWDFLNSSPSGESLIVASSLSAGPTAAAIRKQAATQIFSKDLWDTQGTTWAIGENFQWHNMSISIASLCNHPSCLMYLILWELYKLNFWYEHLSLDCVMARASWEESQNDHYNLCYGLFPEEGGSMMWSSPLSEDDSGLWGCWITNLFPNVDNFHKLLSC